MDSYGPLRPSTASLRVDTGDLALVLGTEVYEGYNCLQAWAEFSPSHLLEVLNSVRNRILDFALAIWKEDPNAGESPDHGQGTIEPTKVTQIFNTTVYGSANVVGSAHEANAERMKMEITNSTVHQLNLGTILGDMNSSVTTLSESGHAEMATALKTFAEQVAASVELGTTRKEVLENLAFIGQQAARPVADRKQGLLKAALGYVQTTVQVIGALSQAWGTFGPVIEGFLKQ